VLLSEQLADEQLASLYRACDALVHPYRGEGFAMPVLEAMASGIPVITTAGGPTDEFCPPGAGWRIDACRSSFPDARVDRLATAGVPWVLEPREAHLVELLREAAADRGERERRGTAGREAALAYSWERVAAGYAVRMALLRRRRPLLAGPAVAEAYPFEGGASMRLLAAPAWRGGDRLGELLAEWCASDARGQDASLVLLADPLIDGTPAELEARVLEAAAMAGADLESAGDINLLMEPLSAERDRRLHAAVDGYVRLHEAAPGHDRLAVEQGNELLEPSSGRLAALLARRDDVRARSARPSGSG
jgi:hypothetical protein